MESKGLGSSQALSLASALDLKSSTSTPKLSVSAKMEDARLLGPAVTDAPHALTRSFRCRVQGSRVWSLGFRV